ncbi:MAG: hypothetical protein AAFO58_11625 [Pseudomonadota bacterium]
MARCGTPCRGARPVRPREAKVTGALSNAFAFGGLNAVLALRAV